MDTPTGPAITLWPLLVYFAAVLTLLTSMLALSYVLGQRHQESATGEPYESGIISTGSVHVRLDVKFYLIAMFFVIFDFQGVARPETPSLSDHKRGERHQATVLRSPNEV